VVGNHLVGGAVLDAMMQAWNASEGRAMEHRLLAALAAGRDSGGDHAGARSSALKVAVASGATRTDLRVDWAPDRDDAVAGLARLVELWMPLTEYYLRRPHEPELGSWEEWSRPGDVS
jgi:uncharacterized Ntn-hydrolase superfamily protein